MRNTLFWRILLAFILPFTALILFFIQSDDAVQINSILQKYSLQIVLCFSIVIFLFVTIARLYTHPIEKLSETLHSPTALSAFFYRTKLLPRELQKLIKRIIDLNNRYLEERADFASNEAVFSSILRNMRDGILLVDQNGMVTLINQATCQWFNVVESEAKGRTLVEVIRHYKMNELFSKVLLNNKPSIESFETAPEKIFIQCIATPMDEGESGSILFLMQDLTRIRQLEIVRRDFVSNVSHELRTPLTSLKLIAETLQDGLLEHPDEAQTFLAHMNAEVDNLTQIVEELLELSKIESGKVPLEKRLVNPCQLLSSAQERMSLQIKRAKLELKLNCPNDLPTVYIDQTRIERVLINLIHNAIKFTPPNGRVELSVFQETNQIVFTVKDTGIGISPKDLSRIFERFYKSDRSRSQRGTGLGLSIAKHLVEAHGGKIWAESQINQGSTFFFSFPITHYH